MRPLVILAAALPLALGCAQQSTIDHSALPKEGGPLQVQLFPLSADRSSVDYILSEPAYVAIFAVTRGQGINLVYPYSPTQIDRPGRRGINQVPRRAGGSVYYIIASRYPLPVEGILQSKSLLRQLVGEDAFRGAKLAETWNALNNIMVPELPDEAWSWSLNTYRSAGYAALHDPLSAGHQAFFSQLFSYGRTYR
ncbi:MAG: hypothetical protein WDZ58_05100 [Gemmatimonadaceae bacterium]